MEPVGHIAGIAAAVTGFISIMAVPISILLAVLLQIGRCHYLLAFRYVQHYQSDYLFI
jgi:hypothetical protein